MKDNRKNYQDVVDKFNKHESILKHEKIYF